MAQYITRPLSQVWKIADAINANLSALIGCRVGELGWSPFVAKEVCGQLQLERTMTTNIGLQTVPDGIGGVLTFDPAVTDGTTALYDKAKQYSPDVLNPYYVMLLGDQIPVSASLSDQLHLAASQAHYTDSTIFDAIYNNTALSHTSIYKNVAWLLMSTFAVRYYLFTFTNELNTTEVNASLCERLSQNVDFVKAQIATQEIPIISWEQSFNHLSRQLSFLRKNFNMIKSQLLVYIRE